MTALLAVRILLLGVVAAVVGITITNLKDFDDCPWWIAWPTLILGFGGIAIFLFGLVALIWMIGS